MKTFKVCTTAKHLKGWLETIGAMVEADEKLDKTIRIPVRDEDHLGEPPMKPVGKVWRYPYGFQDEPEIGGHVEDNQKI